jgi:KDO2-lipid IV(A) lauroyltransferase
MADTIRLTRFWRPRWWPMWLGLALLRLVTLLPLPLMALLGAALGLLFYALHTGRRRIVWRNIERCFPELARPEQGRIVRAHYRAAGQAVFDVGIAWWSSRARLERLIGFRGREHFDRARTEGKNIILLAPHFVCLELGGERMSMEGALVSVFRHPDNELLRAVMERGRMRFGAHLVEHNKPFTALVRQVRNGSLFYYLPDQDAGRRNSVFAPFFGIPAATFAVLPRLAQLTDAVVLPCITYQLPYGRGYEVVFHPPLHPYPTHDVVADTTRMNQVIEQAVRERPEQYFWLHKRFKTRPEGERDFYRR